MLCVAVAPIVVAGREACMREGLLARACGNRRYFQARSALRLTLYPVAHALAKHVLVKVLRVLCIAGRWGGKSISGASLSAGRLYHGERGEPRRLTEKGRMALCGMLACTWCFMEHKVGRAPSAHGGLMKTLSIGYFDG
jgi:hypothetical protein